MVKMTKIVEMKEKFATAFAFKSDLYATKNSLQRFHCKTN